MAEPESPTKPVDVASSEVKVESQEKRTGPPWACKGEWKGPPGPPWKLFAGELTKEELEVFKDCRKNAFYYRGLPLGIGAATLTYYGAGRFAFIKRWSLLFYPGTFLFGLFAGMASYRKTCFKRIMALENSPLKEKFKAMRKDHPWFTGKRGWVEELPGKND